MEQKFFDTNLVAYLLTKEFTESSLPKTVGKQLFFFFEVTPELQKEIDNFYLSQPTVSAQAFAYHLRRIRIMFSQMKDGKGGDL